MPAPCSGWHVKKSGRDAHQLATKLPKWNATIRSLCMNFHGDRVLASSAKNYVFMESLGEGA